MFAVWFDVSVPALPPGACAVVKQVCCSKDTSRKKLSKPVKGKENALEDRRKEGRKEVDVERDTTCEAVQNLGMVQGREHISFRPQPAFSYTLPDFQLLL